MHKISLERPPSLHNHICPWQRAKDRPCIQLYSVGAFNGIAVRSSAKNTATRPRAKMAKCGPQGSLSGNGSQTSPRASLANAPGNVQRGASLAPRLWESARSYHGEGVGPLGVHQCPTLVNDGILAKRNASGE